MTWNKILQQVLVAIKKKGKSWQETEKEKLWQERRRCSLFIHQPTGNGNYSGRIIRSIRMMGQGEVGGEKKMKETELQSLTLTYALIYFHNYSHTNITFNNVMERRFGLLNFNISIYFPANGNECYSSPIYCFGFSGLVLPST
jgi:hypothetical protein